MPSKTCLKCGHENQDFHPSPAAACPACGAIYSKVEKAQGQQTTPPSPAPAAPPEPPPARGRGWSLPRMSVPGLIGVLAGVGVLAAMLINPSPEQTEDIRPARTQPAPQPVQQAPAPRVEQPRERVQPTLGNLYACVTEDLLSQLVRANTNRDGLATAHLLQNGCIQTRAGIPVTVLSRTLRTAHVRAYLDDGRSVELWTFRENVRQ